MRDGHRIIDADRHVIEPTDLWGEYLDPAYRDHAPYFERPVPTETEEQRVARLGEDGRVALGGELMVDGEPVFGPRTERTRIELAKVAHARTQQTFRGRDPQGQLAAMDEEGVDLAFIYPTVGSFLLAIDDMAADVAAAFARAYNDWLRDFCSAAPERLRGVGLLSRHDPVDLVSELDRVADFGWTAVVLRPNPVKGRTLSHPDYEPFWAACERRSIAVSIHEGAHSRLPTVGSDRYDTRFGRHACSHSLEMMMALLSLIEGGVLERHPDLRVCFFEAGCSWLPYWLWRLDEIEYEPLAGEVRENVRRKPSEYFQRQCFVTIEPGEPSLSEVIRLFGADNLMFGSDFPHFDHELDVVEQTLSLGTRTHGGGAGLARGVLAQILADNAARFYGVEPG
ncbi:amidohydrolase family protein [Haliangium sp.]|uniref:amidohydrolase family protein n=1 Tax=Haliangium sp. TaxID=2663208 RepID=UPI003D0F3540